jgi:hypothetical protein
LNDDAGDMKSNEGGTEEELQKLGSDAGIS